jgi:hypothetical protein
MSQVIEENNEDGIVKDGVLRAKAGLNLFQNW